MLRYWFCLFQALTGGSPSAGALTVDCGGITHTGCAVIVGESNGEVDLADAIVQVDTVLHAFGAGPAAASMAAFADANNAAFSCWALDITAAIDHEGTELGDVTYSTPAARLQAQYLATQDTTPGVNWTGSANAAGVAAEVRIAAGPTTHFGASSLTASFNVASSGFKKTFGASTQTLAFGFGSAGVARKFGASSQTLTFGFTSAGHAKKFGASTLPLVFGITSNGVIVPPGPVTHFGAATLTLTVGLASSGFKRTFGSSTLPLVVGVTSAGRKKTFGASTQTLTFGITTAGRVKTFGVSSLPVVFTFTSNGTASGPAPDVVPATVTIQNAAQTAMTALLDATGIMVVVADPAEVELSTETLTGPAVSVVETGP